MKTYQSNFNGASASVYTRESVISVGAIVAIVLVVVATAIGSSTWAYKVYKNRKSRRDSAKQAQDSLLNSFIDETDPRSLRRIVEGNGRGMSCSQYGSLQGKDERVSPTNGKTIPSKHLASPINEDDHTNSIWEGNLGTLEFSASYDNQKQILLVSVLRCSDLPSKETQLGTSDPYVKLQLLPEKRQRVKTQIQRKTLNPVFGETFTFPGFTLNQVKSISLHFVILSFDRFSRDDIIGEVVCPLTDLDLNIGSEVVLNKEIQPRRFKAKDDDRGELLLSICHQPAAKLLTVVILKARNLPKTDATGLAGDPYVKLYLVQNGQRIAKKKTHVKKRTLNPVYNQSFSFDLMDNDNLHNISLEILIMDYDRVTKNDVIGRLIIGYGFGEKEEQHWIEVNNNPRKQMAEWHKLSE